MLLDYLNVPDAWWRLYAYIAVLGLGFVIVILLRKDIKDLTTTEFTGSIYIFGFFLAFTLFSNFKEFITEMRSEIVGMCIDIGLVYLIIEHTLSNDRKREEREKEKSAYKHYLRENLSYLLPELDRRYMSLFKDSTTKDISDYFVENFDEQNIKWELFAGNSGTRSYNYLFREFASKEVEKLILIYNRVMPNDLLHHLLSLETQRQGQQQHPNKCLTCLPHSFAVGVHFPKLIFDTRIYFQPAPAPTNPRLGGIAFCLGLSLRLSCVSVLPLSCLCLNRNKTIKKDRFYYLP
ncbi:hypothetical protein [Thermoactinomyces vulgaris]|uniref:hypothetical protein n=1 Tax=Thermoactinomyces vulgaris TaxID=2026 RepID=UPI00363AE0E6